MGGDGDKHDDSDSQRTTEIQLRAHPGCSRSLLPLPRQPLLSRSALWPLFLTMPVGFEIWLALGQEGPALNDIGL
jgi:hypothetical protein